MNHPMPETNTLLKQLRLSHMAEHLAQRNRQAIENKLTYPEFLTLLLQDEMLYRDNKKLIVRLKRAGFQGEKTIENFNFDFNPKINRAYLQDLAACRFVAEKSPVLIVGPCDYLIPYKLPKPLTPLIKKWLSLLKSHYLLLMTLA
jgi:DNA replication protein DnaC